MRQSGYILGGDYGGGGDDGSGSGSGGVSCQDCGNKAKKDCQHIRCRTCCRNRGLPCKTHVKSTWVPAAKRRERHQQLALSTEQQNSGDQQLSLMTTSDGGAELPITRLHGTSPGFDHFPAEVHSPAVFRCVRVSGMEETNEQLAYQTAISIGGHVFNGILYDHGPDHGQFNHPKGERTSSGGGTSGGAQHQEVNMITSGTTAAATTTGFYPAVTILDPSSMYPTPLCAFMAGTQFFPPPRS